MKDEDADLPDLLRNLSREDRLTLMHFMRASESRRERGADLEEEILVSIAMKWHASAKALT